MASTRTTSISACSAARPNIRNPQRPRASALVLGAAPPKQAGKPTNCQPSGHAGSGQGRVRGELETVEGVGEDGRGALRPSRTNGSRPSSDLSYRVPYTLADIGF